MEPTEELRHSLIHGGEELQLFVGEDWLGAMQREECA
jgi:hypothetical protein